MRDKGVQPIRLATWALAALAAGMLAAAPALAQTKELRFGHLHSAESPIHKGVTRAAEEFAKTSGGRYKINVFPSSQLGAAREMVAQVIDGTLDFISEGPGSLSNLNKALSLFEAPFVARDWDHVQKMLASPFGQEQLGKLGQRPQHGPRGDLLLRRPPLHHQEQGAPDGGRRQGAQDPGAGGAAVPGHDPGARGDADADEPGRGVPEPPDGRGGRPGEPGRHHQRPEVLRGAEVPEPDRATSSCRSSSW